MSDMTFKSSLLQMQFATEMVKMVLQQAAQDDKDSMEFAAIRMCMQAILDATDDQDKCTARMQVRLAKVMAEVQNG